MAFCESLRAYLPRMLGCQRSPENCRRGTRPIVRIQPKGLPEGSSFRADELSESEEWVFRWKVWQLANAT
jgi:hypothetical protein